MQKTILLTILALCFSALSFATPSRGGETVTVSGVVTSAEDKQPLIYNRQNEMRRDQKRNATKLA